jgi:hypothetical protein
MLLEPQDVELFFRLHRRLIFFVNQRLYIFRELKKYTVFLTATEPSIAYSVLALSQPFEELTGPHLPVLTQTVLLPFKDRIVYDGLMNCCSISFGPGIRRSLNESFKEAKLRHGIATWLPMSDKPMVARKTPKPKPSPQPQLREETALAGLIAKAAQKQRWMRLERRDIRGEVKPPNPGRGDRPSRASHPGRRTAARLAETDFHKLVPKAAWGSPGQGSRSLRRSKRL